MEINASFELGVQGYVGGEIHTETLETYAGFAAQYLYRGANNIYLFNHMRGATGMGQEPEQLAAFRKILDIGGDASVVNALPRRHVLSYGTAWIATESILPLTPAAEWAGFKLNIGGATAGRKGFAVFGFEGTTAPKLEVKVNGAVCTALDEPYGKPCGKVGAATTQYRIPDGTLKDGYNNIEYRLAEGEADRILWFEIWLP